MNRVQMQLIEEIEHNEEDLNDWERRFIDNLQNNYLERVLTTGQNKKLNEIHHRVVFGE